MFGDYDSLLLETKEKKFESLDDRTIPSDREIVEMSRNSMNQEFSPMLMNYQIIDELGDEFDEALEQIRGEQNIGIHGKGVNLSRKGRLCWLVIGAYNPVSYENMKFAYLFDVCALRDRTFNEGLREILENRQILKIIHDCRFLSDALYHQYHISMNNVFDTQVASGFVFRMRNGALPAYADSLWGSIQEHLDSESSPSMCSQTWKRAYITAMDEKMWETRPLAGNGALEVALVAEVAYLDVLRSELIKKMMKDFSDGVQLNLEAFRDTDEDEVSKLIKVSKYSVSKLWIEKTENEKERLARLEQTGGRRECKFWAGRKERSRPIKKALVQYGRSAWHSVLMGRRMENEEEASPFDAEELLPIGALEKFGLEDFDPDDFSDLPIPLLPFM